MEISTGYLNNSTKFRSRFLHFIESQYSSESPSYFSSSINCEIGSSVHSKLSDYLSDYSYGDWKDRSQFSLEKSIFKADMSIQSSDKQRRSENEPLKLTPTSTLFLQSDLQRQLAKFEHWWSDDNETKAKLNKSISQITDLLESLRRDHEQDLNRCVNEARKVSNMVETMLDIVNRITVIMEEMDCPAMLQDNVTALFRLQEMENSCIEYGNLAFRIHTTIMHYAEDLQGIYGNYEKQRQRRKRHTKRNFPHAKPIIAKARTYRRAIEFNGGARPKSTSESDIGSVFEYTRKNVKKFKNGDHVMLESEPPLD